MSYDLHYHDDPKPYLFKTTDFGTTWTNITHDLPAWGSIYVVREDTQNPRVLYVGTESGLFVSIDGGEHWLRWKSNLPHTRRCVHWWSTRAIASSSSGRSAARSGLRDAAVPQQLEQALRQAGIPVRCQTDRGS